MYTIAASSSFFRPYFLGKYELGNIVFYDQNGEVVSSGHGWLDGIDRKDLPKFEMEKTPIQKRKVDFGKMFADRQTFFMKKTEGNYIREHKFVLYVPYIKEEWQIETMTREWGVTKSYYDVHTNKVQGFFVERYIKTEDIKENKEFVDKITEIGKLIVNSESNISEYAILKNRPQIVAAIKAFGVEAA